MNRISALLRCALTVVVVLISLQALTVAAYAQQVFSNDPTDPATGRPYPVLPGLPLLLPGVDEEFGTLDDVINTGITGDVDLAVRVGTIVGSSVPAPAGAVGGPSLATVVAGGGSTGTGGEIDVTVLVSDGGGSPPYGSVITNADLDLRPLVIYAFADLDGDGVVGPTDSDGSFDNTLERQEATAYVGRQVGSLSAGRHFGSLGVHVAAPASMGGLHVALSAGVYTGTDPDAHYSDGTPIHTLWPYFPPLDPKRVIGNGGSPAPDPNVPSEIEFAPEKNYLPVPGTPLLGTPFAIPIDGTEPSTDQFVAISGPVHTAAFFEEVNPSFFRSVSRVWLRPAPNVDGGARVLVLTANALELSGDGAATQRDLRLLPVDLLGNVADPGVGGLSVDLIASPGVRIVAPDADSDTATETLVVSTAAGVVVTLDDEGASGSGSVGILSGSRILGTLPVTIVSPGTGLPDSDEDGVAEDGNASQLAGDLPCSADDVTALLACDDNCAGIVNPSQFDDNENGLGDCCDGVCVADPLEPGCTECAVAGNPDPTSAFSKLRLVLRQVTGKPDKLNIRGKFELSSGAAIDPADEDVALVVLQSDVVRYDAVLNSAFERSGNGSRYRYSDPDMTIAGTKKALIASGNGVAFKLNWRAIGVDLTVLTQGGVTLDLALGDDAFSGERLCIQKGKRLICD